MDLEEALMEAGIVVQDQLGPLRRKRDALNREVELLEAEWKGLNLALERCRREREAAEDAEESVVPDNLPWQRMARTEAIVRVLREQGPMGPVDIATQLRSVGRDETNAVVSATLTRLASRGKRVERVGRALWRTPEPVPEPEPDPEPNTVTQLLDRYPTIRDAEDEGYRRGPPFPCNTDD